MTRHRSDETPAFGSSWSFKPWSQEPTEGSKPVLRFPSNGAALAQCGIKKGGIGSDEILFVNNLPDAGILGGATPVVVTDPSAFRRALGPAREPHRAMSPALAVISLTERSRVR